MNDYNDYAYRSRFSNVKPWEEEGQEGQSSLSKEKEQFPVSTKDDWNNWAKYHFQPPKSFLIETVGRVNNPTVGSLVTVCSFTLPASMEGVIKEIGQHASVSVWEFPSGSPTSEWSLHLNNGTITGFNAIQYQFATMINPKIVTIKVKSGDVIDLKINLLQSVGTVTVMGRFSGWYWTI